MVAAFYIVALSHIVYLSPSNFFNHRKFFLAIHINQHTVSIMPNTNQTKPYSIHRNVNIFEHYEMVPHVTKHKDGTETVHDDRLEVTGYNFTGGAFHDTINSVVESVDDIWDKLFHNTKKRIYIRRFFVWYRNIWNL
jgi:hypothetical protein